jgi:hypothetical protein
MTGEEISNERTAADDASPRTDAASLTSAQDGYDAQQIIALARHPPPGASVYSPSAAISAALNPRSCVTCRRRKVRYYIRVPAIHAGHALADTHRSAATSTCRAPTAAEPRYHASFRPLDAHHAVLGQRTTARQQNSRRANASWS